MRTSYDDNIVSYELDLNGNVGIRNRCYLLLINIPDDETVPLVTDSAPQTGSGSEKAVTGLPTRGPVGIMVNQSKHGFSDLCNF